MHPLSRFRKAKFLVLLSVAFYISTISAASITYTLDPVTDFPNPERGMNFQTNWDYQNFSLERLLKARQDSNMTVIRVYYRLDNYYNTDLIPKTFLDKLNNDGEILRKGGVKMVPRFIYNGSTDHCNEPNLTRMLSHIGQIAPVLLENLDVIAFLETGFIGMYGEWHHFGCRPFDPYGLEKIESRRQVLFKVLESIPGVMVTLRYNFHKRPIFNTDIPLGPDSAFSGSYRARVGATNDAFASGADNMGTYQPSSPTQLEIQKTYLSMDNRYVPQGGEAEQPTDNLVAGCDSAVKDLKRMHWDILGYSFDPRMHALWRKEGCREEISRKLGYRIELHRSNLQDSVRPGYLFYGSLQLKNVGYGKIYNPRGCELILRNTTTQEKHVVKLNIDPRRWCMTDSLVNVSIAAPIPSNISAGNYRVYLNLPDTSKRLYGKKEYSIRLANKNLWEDSTGYNSLLHTVTLSMTAPIKIGKAPPISPSIVKVGISRSPSGVQFTLKTTGKDGVTLSIYSLTGQKIWSQSISANTAGEITVHADKIPSGIYFLKISTHEIGNVETASAVEFRRFAI